MRARPGLLEDRGYQVLRLEAATVERDMPSALRSIQAKIEDLQEQAPALVTGNGAGAERPSSRPLLPEVVTPSPSVDEGDGG